ncbi:uncharacterized protein A1O9_05039 [Exophiala aquamarina CBS 119918]|uniref:N-acetyltransferase domain-containing protein n=1 Tax=Exophiala aquamarina CBS 119918 TaxID=1182545 RepID=A0A072PJ96_9EURO|nr:uncharacterized protein A1O9_05039 [Exophiala aquamarina CBS 119918]KEF60189.1 hypothetical protein A1O9_05039 [Exophiala aquamarina CBS 119918]
MPSQAPTPSPPPPPPPPPPQPGARIEIKGVTSVADIPALSKISKLALENDPMWEFRARCGAPSIYDHAMQKLTAAINNPARFTVFKAVVVPSSVGAGEVDQQSEIIVGYSQWMLGYLETPKMDPFAPEEKPAGSGSGSANANAAFEASIPSVGASEAKEKQTGGLDAALEAIASNDNHAFQKSKPFYSNPDHEVSRKMGNAYIRAIRGKRHLCLHGLIVHPAYQRQGIGQKLLDWGIETADRENVHLHGSLSALRTVDEILRAHFSLAPGADRKVASPAPHDPLVEYLKESCEVIARPGSKDIGSLL